MKYIWLGIKDWVKDCWHDWLWLRLEKLYTDPDWIITYYKPCEEKFCETVSWKEGSVWFYIKQRRIAKRKGNDTQHNRPTVG